MKEAYFAGGCFWCITPVFRETEGVKDVVSGYCGGDEEGPVYEQVKSQQTMHRETVRITYDEKTADFSNLMDIFLSATDPFDGGGQYIDRGRSYTLAVYYQNEYEKECAERKIDALEKVSGEKVYISVEPLKVFYLAEEYHQNYDIKNPEAFERELSQSGRKQPVTGDHNE